MVSKFQRVYIRGLQKIESVKIYETDTQNIINAVCLTHLSLRLGVTCSPSP